MEIGHIGEKCDFKINARKEIKYEKDTFNYCFNNGDVYVRNNSIRSRGTTYT